MSSVSAEPTSTRILTELIRLLNQGAPAEDFFAQIARTESLSTPVHEKSAIIECIRMAMAIRNRLELQQQREHGLLAIIESAQDLSSHLDLMGLLRAIVSRARNLLGSHVAWISVYNPEADQLQVQLTDGAIFDETDKMATRKHLGVAGVIFSTGLPFSTPDYLTDDRFRHDPKLDMIFRNEDIAGLVGVPLLSENEVIGLLFVADRYQRSHTALEVSILCTLATHAAVAMKTAKAFDLTNRALKNGDLARAELERHARNVQGAAEAHERLTSLLAQGASLSTLCHTVAHLLDGNILVVDETLQVISRGSNEGGDGPGTVEYDPHGDRSSAIGKALQDSRRAGRSVVAYHDGVELCRVVSVIGGDDVVAGVLIFRRDDLNEISIRTFERSASLIGIVLLSQERMEIHKSRDVAALLRGLLLPRQHEWASTLERADEFNLDVSQSLSLLLFDAENLKATYIAKRLRAIASLSGVVLDELDGAVALVCKTPLAQDVVKTCTRLLAGEFDSTYWGVLSRPVAGAEGLPALYTTLRRALFVARRLGMKGILNQNDLALYSMLFETHDEASLNAFLESSIGTLLSHDQRRGSDLAFTLLCYFDSNRNARLVAKRMNIHVNTVRQRLASIEGIAGHLGNPSRALELHIALRLWVLSRRGDLPASQSYDE